MYKLRDCFILVLLLTLLIVILPLFIWSHVRYKQGNNMEIQINNTQTGEKSYYDNVWRRLYKLSDLLPSYLKRYKIAMDEKEYEISVDLLDVFAKNMERNNLTYLMDGGTLLGSYRHHGPIPWDDDLDVMADIDQKVKVKQVLESLSPDYVLTEGNWGIYKLHSNRNSKETQPEYAWKWPFLDIFWFKANNSHITCSYNKKVYGLDVVFPLKKRPYGDLMLFSPCKVEEYFSKFYTNWRRCLPRIYNHRKEELSHLEQVDVPCLQLKNYYPLVERHHMNNGDITEKIVLEGKYVLYQNLTKC